MMRRTMMPVLALLALAGGCGKELVAGGYTEVRTVATDDAEGERSRGATPATAASRSRSGTAGATVPQGTLELQAAVELIDSRGEAVPISQGSRTVRMRIAAADSAELGRGQVEPGSYTRVRLTFTRVRAEVSGGLSLGGISLLGVVDVAIGPQPLLVELPVQLVVAGEPRTLVLDLNAAVWLAGTDPVTRRVSAATFRDALEVRVR